MQEKVLSVSYDEGLLKTREMLLQTEGYQVSSALGFGEAANQCRAGGFKLFILGHSIPLADKHQLIKISRVNCPAPILSLERAGEPRVDSADYHVLVDDPQELIEKVAEILSHEEGFLGANKAVRLAETAIQRAIRATQRAERLQSKFHQLKQIFELFRVT